MENTNPLLAGQELMTAEEVAQILHVSRATVYRLVDARRVPFVRLWGILRFVRRDVLSLLEEHRVAEPLPTYGSTQNT